jgi:hypothetical protein
VSRGRRVGLRAAALAATALGAALAGCQAQQQQFKLREQSDTYAFEISSDPMPPRARERTTYKVVVRDKETRQPIDNGEGQLFATSRDGANTYDGLEPGREVGTYYANLTFVTAGDWAMGIRFRRDSTHKLERAPDWMQTVLGAREPGGR